MSPKRDARPSRRSNQSFSGGTLLAVIAISIFVDEYIERAGLRK